MAAGDDFPQIPLDEVLRLKSMDARPGPGDETVAQVLARLKAKPPPDLPAVEQWCADDGGFDEPIQVIDDMLCDGHKRTLLALRSGRPYLRMTTGLASFGL